MTALCERRMPDCASAPRISGSANPPAASTAGHRLLYRGQLDGSRPGNDHPLDGRDLRAALEARGIAVRQLPLPDQGIPTDAEAAALVKAGKARLIDVRSREEWDAVHIEGSTFFTQELNLLRKGVL